MMKKKIPFVILLILIVSLCACAKQEKQNLANMTTSIGNGYTAISWENRTYVPYCVVEKNRCGKQIGIVNGDKEDKVFEYKGYSTDEWITNMYVSGLMDNPMLYREIGVTNIPAGLESEYEWNN